MSDALKVQDTPVNGDPVGTKSTEDVKTGSTPEVDKTDYKAEAEKLQAEAENAKKEVDKANMRINQLQNQLERVSSTEDSEELKQALAQAKAELDEFKKEQEEARQAAEVAETEKELNNIFEKALADFPETVQEFARFNRDEYGIWNFSGEAGTYFQAEQNIKKALDKMASKFKSEDKKTPGAPIPAGNPKSPGLDKPLNLMSSEEMEKLLPHV